MILPGPASLLEFLARTDFLSTPSSDARNTGWIVCGYDQFHIGRQAFMVNQPARISDPEWNNVSVGFVFYEEGKRRRSEDRRVRTDQ